MARFRSRIAGGENGEQAAAMATRSLELLREAGVGLPDIGPDLGEPGEPTFRVGEIGIGVEGEHAIVALSPTDEVPGVTFQVTLLRLGAMARRAGEVVAAGRPPCRLCGRPLDPDGHVCPTSNGDLRHSP